MLEPTNEQGVIAYFCMNLHDTDWEIVSIGCRFPDAILRFHGQEWRTEFEYRASNFELHGHDPYGCDLVICWTSDLSDFPVPILALDNPGWKTQQIVRGNKYLVQIDYWKARALRAESRVRELAGVAGIAGYDADISSQLLNAIAMALHNKETISLNEVSRLSVALGGRTVGRDSAREILKKAGEIPITPFPPVPGSLV